MHVLTRWLQTGVQVKGTRAIRRLFAPRSTAAASADGVVMFHIGRCGSSVLGDLLDQHDAIRWYGEIYEGYENSRNPVGIVPLVKGLRCAYEFAGWEIKFLAAQHLHVIGFGLESLLRELDAHGITRFVVLQRRNLLRRMISHVVAQETKRYQQRRGSASLTRISLDVHRITIKATTKTLLEWFRLIDEEYSRLNAALSASRVVALTYEQDVESDPLIGYRRICTFLDLPPQEVTVRLRRMNPYSVQETLSNFEDVVRHLDGTPYAWMLQ